MRFIELCDELIKSYGNDFLIRENGTILLAPGKIPNARHYFYKGLKEEYLIECLEKNYKYQLPSQYCEFLRKYNGATLFSIQLEYDDNIAFALSLFEIFGLPLTAPYNRPQDEEEPFDVRIEDLGRHRKIPDQWIKCGCYVKNLDFDTYHDIFVNTLDGKTYSCIKNKKDIEQTWNTLDECFCEVFNSLRLTKLVYSGNEKF